MSALLTGAGFAAWSGERDGQAYVALNTSVARQVISDLTYLRENAHPQSVRLIVRWHEDNSILAKINNYFGAVPRVGDVFLLPPLEDDGTSDLSMHRNNVTDAVRLVNWGILGRPQGGEDHYTGRPVQVVEIVA
jgi:hypothetical protein